jgi:Domain of unknown function (DUF4249)
MKTLKIFINYLIRLLNKQMKKTVSFITSFLLILACREKEIEYDLPFEGEKLVVIGILNPDETFNVKVTHTWTPTGIIPKNTFVNDATVTVLEDGKLKEQLIFEKDGNYISSKGGKPLFGRNYTVEVTSPKYSKVYSEKVKLPNNNANYTFEQISDIIYKYNAEIPKDQISITITDNSFEQNYYAVGFNLFGKFSDDGKSQYTGSSFYINDDDKKTQNKECSFNASFYKENIGEGVRVFNNQCFTTSKPVFNFVIEKAYYNGFQNNKTIYKKIEKPTLNVYQFDKGYFEYLKLKDQPEGLFERAFTEPHTTYTNIKGGYGIIGAITKKSEVLNMTCKICQ